MEDDEPNLTLGRLEEIIEELFKPPCNLTPNQIQIIERVAKKLNDQTIIGTKMNGLDEESVEYIVDTLKNSIKSAHDAKRIVCATELKHVLKTIRQIQQINKPQPNRPDRIGDECWYAEGKTWYKGTLRAWLPGIEYGIATIVVEDEQGNILYPSQISFAKEPPQ